MDDRPARDEERGFPADRYFYSRIDAQGRVAFGNDLFFEVSGYPREALVGASHLLVRHPEMPRGPFVLTDGNIAAGDPFGAYLKNRTRDGRYYWVFALVAPVDDGYLSLRLKPQAPQFAQARAHYAALRAAEDGGASPADSAALLVGRLAQAGYPSHDAFMAAAVVAEVRARQQARAFGRLAEIEALERLRAGIGTLAQEQAALLETFAALHLVPTNMRILASRLEPTGGPVSAISDSYKRASAEIAAVIGGMAGQGGEGGAMLRAVDRVLFDVGFAAVCEDAIARLRRDPEGLTRSECDVFAGMIAARRQHARTHVASVSAAVRRLSQEGDSLQRLMSGLDQIRILGEVESGRSRSGSGLAAMMEQLDGFHASIHARLDRMIGLTARMRSGMMRLAA